MADWQSVKIYADAHSAETLSDSLLTLGALSVALEDADAGTAAEQPLFGEPSGSQNWDEHTAAPSAWRNSVIAALFPMDADVAAILACASADANLAEIPRHTTETIPDQDWVRTTQAQFEPLQITQRLWIVPTWHNVADTSAINIRLDPGLAFGTGSHPTTRLCLRWLDQNIKGGETVIDYGCGSGILAIAALKLGAAKATGIDLDPQAIRASEENAKLNETGAEFLQANTRELAPADLVIANILANPLIVLAPLLANVTRDGGTIILSGILAEQAEAVLSVYRKWFEIREAASDEGWVCLEGIKNCQIRP